MKRSQVKAVVEANIGPLTEAHGVPHWKIWVAYEKAGDADVPGFSAPARCDRNPAYESAVVTLDPEELGSAEEVIDHFCHELRHVVLAPFDLYRGFVQAGIKSGSPESERERRQFHYAVEQAVISVGRLWRGALARGAEQERARAKRAMSKVHKSSGNKSGPTAVKKDSAAPKGKVGGKAQVEQATAGTKAAIKKTPRL